jgi:hypothetical protein
VARAVHQVVGARVARVEAFGCKVGNFNGVAATAEAGGHLRRDGMGERLRIVMSDNDECVHDLGSLSA